MKKIIFALTIMGSLFGLSVANAQGGESRTNEEITNEIYPELKPYGWAPFVSGSGGYTAENEDLNVEGRQQSLKGIASYYTDGAKGVFDVGFGSVMQRFDDEVVLDRELNANVMELAARYHTSGRWQYGVVTNTYFDAGANFGADQADAIFGGVQLMKEFSLNQNFLARFGVRAMTDVNVEDEDVNMGMIDLQIGWHPNLRARAETTTIETTTESTTDSTTYSTEE